MNTVQRITKNSGFLAMGDAVNALLGILFVVCLARYLGAAEYGKYTFAIAFTSLFLILSDLGLSILSIREIARDTQKANEYVTSISLTKLVLSLIMVSLIAIVINLMHYPRDTTTVVYIAGFITVFTSFSVFFRSIFRAFEKMEYDAITRIAERVLVVGAALTVLFLGYGLIQVVSAMLLAQIFSFLFTLIVCIKKFAKPRLAFDFALTKHLVKTALPFAVTSVFGAIIFQTDTVMLSIMKGDAVVGWYNAANRLILGMLFIPAVFTGSIFPVISRYFISSKDNLVIAYEKSLKILATMAIPLGIGTTLIAKRVIFFLYGNEFANSVIVLQILVWAVSLIFLVTLIGHTLASINKQIVDMRIVGICALLNVALNLILIPGFSYIGAAIASVITQVVVFTLEFSYLQKHLHKFNLFRMVSKPLGAAIIMGVLVYILNNILDTTAVSLFVIIFGAIAVYGLFLYLFKAFDHQELQLIKSAFNRRAQ